MIKCRYFKTRIGSLWLSAVHDASASSTSVDKQHSFDLHIFVQALDQAINLVEADYAIHTMRLIKDFCERGGKCAHRAIMSIHIHDALCTVLEPIIPSKNAKVMSAHCMMLSTSPGSTMKPPDKIIGLIEEFLSIILILCGSQEMLDDPHMNVTVHSGESSLQGSSSPSSKAPDDLISVIVDSRCAEMVYGVLAIASGVESIRSLGRKLFYIVMTAGVSSQVLEYQEMWAGVAVRSLCAAATFGSGEEVNDACKNLRICAGDGNIEHWRDFLLSRYVSILPFYPYSKCLFMRCCFNPNSLSLSLSLSHTYFFRGLSECLTKTVLCFKNHQEAIRSICILASVFCGSPPCPQYARDFSSVGQALCETMAYWSDQVNEYDKITIGNPEWYAALDVLQAAATALSSLSCNFSTNKLLVSAGAVEMVCETITSKHMAKRNFLPSSFMIYLTNLLGNLCAWPGNTEGDYELGSLANAVKLLSEWEQKLVEEFQGSDPTGPSPVTGGNEEERIAYCHFVQTISTATPFLIEMIVKAGAPAAISAILHNCTISPSPTVVCEAFVAIRSMYHPKVYKMSEVVLSTIWNGIISALNMSILNSSTVEEGILAMNALVLKDTLDSEKVWVDFQKMILQLLDKYSEAETVIEATLVLLSNVYQRQRTGAEIHTVPGLVRRMAVASTKFRFNDCIIEAVKAYLDC